MSTFLADSVSVASVFSTEVSQLQQNSRLYTKMVAKSVHVMLHEDALHFIGLSTTCSEALNLV